MKLPDSAWEAFILFAKLREAGGKDVSIKSTTPDGPKIFAPYPKNNLDERTGDAAAWELVFMMALGRSIAGGFASADEIENALKTAANIAKHDETFRLYNCGFSPEPPCLSADLMQSEAESIRLCERLSGNMIEAGVILRGES